MAKRHNPVEAHGDQPDELTPAVNRLAEQIQVLREAIDEFREIFTWAVRSDRLRGGDREKGSLDSDTSADHPETEQDGEQHERIVAAVQDSLNDVCGDLEEAVRDQLKQELAGFRHSLDQFSIDIQWAARQVRQASTVHQTETSSSPVAEPTRPDDPTTEHAAVESPPTNHPGLQTTTRDARQPFLFQAE